MAPRNAHAVHRSAWIYRYEDSSILLKLIIAGFSFDELCNGTIDYLGKKTFFEDDIEIPESTRWRRVGTLARDANMAINTSDAVARSIWQVLNVWAVDFPHRPRSTEVCHSTCTCHRSPRQVNLWTSSYGGHFVPSLAAYMLARSAEKGQKNLHLKSIGLQNGCIDARVQLPSYPRFARNNTYGIQAIDEATYAASMKAWSSDGGCRTQIDRCRRSVPSPDLGYDNKANRICHDANVLCGTQLATILEASGRNFYDIAVPSNILLEPTLDVGLGWLNQRNVQASLGVPLNFSANSQTTNHLFSETGDNIKGDQVRVLGDLLDRGVQVVLVYGDRDYACNCKSSHIR